MATRKKKDEVQVVVATPMQPTVQPAPRQELILEGDPEKQLEFAHKAATALMKRVNGKKRQVVINGKQYLEFGDWQTLARFFGATVGTEWTQPIMDSSNKLIGFEARAIVTQNGQVISSAEARCMRSEKRWGTADEYAVNSMAQTRASAKALRNGFGWVAELAGYSSTPAEEMPGAYDTSPIRDNAKVVSTADDELEYMESLGSDGLPNNEYIPVRQTPAPAGTYVCADTGKTISKAEYDFSMRAYGKPLSFAAQKNNTRIK